MLNCGKLSTTLMAKQANNNRPNLRELPAYSVAEVAHYLNLPKSTVRYWAMGRDSSPALIEAAALYPVALSFLNLVELHVLAAIRRKHTVPMHKVRSAIDYLQESTRNESHPLLSQQLQTDGLDLFVEQYGKLVNISMEDQLEMREVVQAALQRIKRDSSGIPIKLYPFTRSRIDNAPAIVVIDPALSAGRPVITGTGLATEIIAERCKAGEMVAELARDYGRQETEIEEAIRYELRAAA